MAGITDTNLESSSSWNFPRFSPFHQQMIETAEQPRDYCDSVFPWWCGSVVAMVLVHCSCPELVLGAGTIFTNHDRSNIINSHFTLHVGFYPLAFSSSLMLLGNIFIFSTMYICVRKLQANLNLRWYPIIHNFSRLERTEKV